MKKHKIKFFKTPDAAALLFSVFILCFIVFIVFLLAFIVEKNAVYLCLSCGAIVISISTLFLNFYYFMQTIEFHGDKIIMRNVFKKINECLIDNIKQVYVKEYWKEGKFIIIADSNQMVQPGFECRNTCIRFRYNSKNLLRLKNIWTKEIIFLPSEIS